MPATATTPIAEDTVETVIEVISTGVKVQGVKPSGKMDKS
jgi:hypothetical protein